LGRYGYAAGSRSAKTGGQLSSVSFSHNWATLAVSDEDGAIRVWQAGRSSFLDFCTVETVAEILQSYDARNLRLKVKLINSHHDQTSLAALEENAEQKASFVQPVPHPLLSVRPISGLTSNLRNFPRWRRISDCVLQASVGVSGTDLAFTIASFTSSVDYDHLPLKRFFTLNHNYRRQQ
jgi:hypothetical protein